ncbi:hypothetical protein TNCV_971761 [Trichonephila clavipes]|nr:hypothetical protein TNCV_971761 [Trichonephila clavipes]
MYVTLGAKVQEQMSRSGGQSEVKPSVFSPQASLVLIYRPTEGCVDLAETEDRTQSRVSFRASGLQKQSSIPYQDKSLMRGMTRVGFFFLLSGMTVIGWLMESGRRGYGASSGCDYSHEILPSVSRVRVQVLLKTHGLQRLMHVKSVKVQKRGSRWRSGVVWREGANSRYRPPHLTKTQKYEVNHQM